MAGMTLAEGGLIEARLCQIVPQPFGRLRAARARHASGKPVSKVVRTSSGWRSSPAFR